MSVKLTTKVWADKSITGLADLVVMLALADSYNPENGCFPSLDTLQEKTRLSRFWLVCTLDRLAATGHIEKTVGRGRGQRNSYRIYPEKVNSVDYLDRTEKVNSVAEKGQLSCEKGSTQLQEIVHSVDPFSLENPKISELLTVRNRNRTVKARNRASIVSSVSDLQIPAALQTPEFLAALAEWIEYRRTEIKKPLKLLSAQKQLKEFESWGPGRAIAAIDQSIKNTWQGIFESPGNNGAGKPKPKITGIVQL